MPSETLNRRSSFELVEICRAGRRVYVNGAEIKTKIQQASARETVGGQGLRRWSKSIWLSYLRRLGFNVVGAVTTIGQKKGFHHS